MNLFQGPDDPDNWFYKNKQYSLQILIYFLVSIKNIDMGVLHGYYSAVRDTSPQEYWYKELGGKNLRSMFADWVIHTSADMDYLTREEFEFSKRHYYGVYNDLVNKEQCAGATCEPHFYVWEGADNGTGGFLRPPTNLTPRGWSHNVWRVSSTFANNYT